MGCTEKPSSNKPSTLDLKNNISSDISGSNVTEVPGAEGRKRRGRNQIEDNRDNSPSRKDKDKSRQMASGQDLDKFDKSVTDQDQPNKSDLGSVKPTVVPENSNLIRPEAESSPPIKIGK